ncbi:hypothetical protein V5O48_006664 [Marasmius crinis-equi]|uniref:Uncharacterized protein n=1 Tax=Marasmius crinis-equi TaxID=585013 RepID=A0ABR3FJA5_9AGAR
MRRALQAAQILWPNKIYPRKSSLYVHIYMLQLKDHHKFRRQTPGEPNAPVTFSHNVIDPTHPGFKSPRKIFPQFYGKGLNLTAIPFGLLPKYDIVPPAHANIYTEPWAERVERTALDPGFIPKKPGLLPIRLANYHPQNRRLPMSTRITIPIKTTSRKKVVRGRIANKLRTAIALATVGGAEVRQVNGKETLVMNDEYESQVLKEMIKSGWMYWFTPSLEVYLMPYTKLVPLVGNALTSVGKRIVEMETRWAAQALPKAYLTMKTQQADNKQTLKELTRPSTAHTSDLHTPFRLGTRPPASPSTDAINNMSVDADSSRYPEGSWRSLFDEDSFDDIDFRDDLLDEFYREPNEFAEEDSSFASKIHFTPSSSLTTSARSSTSSSSKSRSSKSSGHHQPRRTTSGPPTPPTPEPSGPQISATQKIFDFKPILGKVPQAKVPHRMKIRGSSVEKTR